jgi:nucleoside-diphosphate-sugar epimerase
MNVLVTGGTGFVGSHLVRRLLARGHRVTCLDRHPGLFDDELRAGGASLISGSVTDADDVERVMAGQEVVFHLASPFGDILEPDAAYWAIEVEGTRNVLAAAEREGVRRVVHCSTQGVHGIIADPPGDEDLPIAPRDYYCHSKADTARPKGRRWRESSSRAGWTWSSCARHRCTGPATSAGGSTCFAW